MTTKQRFRNNKYRLELRERDHLPAHVHLVGGEVDVMIAVETLHITGDCPSDSLHEAFEWIEAHRDELMEEWKKWHP